MLNFKKVVLLFLAMLVVLPTMAATEWVNGELIRIDLGRRKAVIKHEYIPSIKMDAMTMPFKIANQIPLENFKAGDRVRFQVQVVDGDLDINAMEKR